MVIKTEKLGFAAYLKMKSDSKSDNVSFVSVEDNFFIFNSERDEKDWLIEYLNSCCKKHDACLMELRGFRRQR